MKVPYTRVKKSSRKLASSILTCTESAVAKARKNDVAMNVSFRHAVSDAIKNHHKNDIPVAKFDIQRGQVYYLHSDGSRTYETT